MSTGSVSDGFEANPTHVPFEGMRWVPGGTFAMGSEDFYPEERPVHRASVDGFWIDEHPITAAEFRRFVRETSYVTVAERPLDPEQYPDADPDLPHATTRTMNTSPRPRPHVDVQREGVGTLGLGRRLACVRVRAMRRWVGARDQEAWARVRAGRLAQVRVSGGCLTACAQAPSLAEVACRVVCISHKTGSGGEEVGRLVAERLGFLYVDDDIVARAAARGGISAADVADEERRKSFVSRLLEALAIGTSEVGGTAVVHGVDNDDVRALIRETIERTAARGNAVIVAHAASHVVEPGDEALRVLVTATPSTRAHRLAAAEALEQAKAARVVKDSDAGRRDYLKRFYEIDEELPTHYDLIVNTDVLSVERAADLVSRAAAS